jgi:hypothetical protein
MPMSPPLSEVMYLTLESLDKPHVRISKFEPGAAISFQFH